MPELDSLKAFSSDMLSLGDETNVRLKRGERARHIPLPGEEPAPPVAPQTDNPAQSDADSSQTNPADSATPAQDNQDASETRSQDNGNTQQGDDDTSLPDATDNTDTLGDTDADLSGFDDSDLDLSAFDEPTENTDKNARDALLSDIADDIDEAHSKTVEDAPDTDTLDLSDMPSDSFDLPDLDGDGATNNTTGEVNTDGLGDDLLDDVGVPADADGAASAAAPNDDAGTDTTKGSDDGADIATNDNPPSSDADAQNIDAPADNPEINIPDSSDIKIPDDDDIKIPDDTDIPPTDELPKDGENSDAQSAAATSPDSQDTTAQDNPPTDDASVAETSSESAAPAQDDVAIDDLPADIDAPTGNDAPVQDTPIDIPDIPADDDLTIPDINDDADSSGETPKDDVPSEGDVADTDVSDTDKQDATPADDFADIPADENGEKGGDLPADDANDIDTLPDDISDAPTDSANAEGTGDAPIDDIPANNDEAAPTDSGTVSNPDEIPPADNASDANNEGTAPADDFDMPNLDDGGGSSNGSDTSLNLDDIPDAPAAKDDQPSDFDNIPGVGDISDKKPDDFDLEDKSKVKVEMDDFEIPGYSESDDDDEEAKEAAGKVLDRINKDLPPNTLTDEQYKEFRKNFSNYPLNVRLAIEELFTKDEFTDDTEFDVVQKIVNKVPARKLASDLEKMLDVSLPVPKDFEKRSSAEYDLYKSSFEYQLRNRIIPGALICAGAAIVCFLLFLFGKNCIYKPLKANSLYSQGYDYLQESDYPQSEAKFKEAVTYGAQKKWFYKYAQGYRDHKQYIRAEKMYENTLKVFNHEKAAGLQWADMETNELANYEKAENIILREVLDYHVNDPDALLALADNYLEWATEKDPSKFDSARGQYLNLLDMYGNNEKSQDLYLSRMLRYFVRTDNLQKVLETKGRFMAKTKEAALSAQDWTDLSGFLLDKLYGPLEPGDEYLRAKIEDVKETLMRSLRADENNPVALYNMARYYIQMHDDKKAYSYLNEAIGRFDTAPVIKKRDMYKYIDSYRLLGEEYTNDKEFLKAQESFTKGISLFNRESEDGAIQGTPQIGKLYYNMADIDYFISGNLDSALLNYEDAIKNQYDNSEGRYKIGALLYNKNNYTGALSSFMKAIEDSPDDSCLLLAMGNTLSLRGADYLAEGYYENLIDTLNGEKAKKGILFPQTDKDDEETMDFYVKGCNNLGVTMHRIAKQSGDSSLNAKAIVNLQQSLRAYDNLTRNSVTMVRLGGSNLAEENIKYITQSSAQYEPAIYTDIPRALNSDEGLHQ